MRFLMFAAIGLLAAGCGGGGGGSPAPSAQPVATPRPSDATFGGIWSGTLTHPDQTFEEVLALTTADGRFEFIALDTFGPGTIGLYTGTAAVDVDHVTGSGKAYAPVGASWPSGSSVAAISIDATVQEKLALDGRLTADGVDLDLALDYERDLYEQASSLTLLTGVWYVYDDTLNPVITFTFEPDGRFLGQNTNGCQSSGQVSIIDARYNLYAWDATVINCPNGSPVSGLGVLVDPESPQPGAFLAAVTNGVYVTLLPLER